jgi:hypothetical protein
MQRYLKFPVTLYRIQGKPTVSLRDYDTQVAKNRTSFDLKLHNQLVMPMPPGSEFHTPNGMSLRPCSEKMIGILKNYAGNTVRVYRMQEATNVPKGFCVFHEHSDHYSLQVASPMPLSEMNQKLTEFLKSIPSVTKEQFLEAYYDVDDQDN